MKFTAPLHGALAVAVLLAASPAPAETSSAAKLETKEEKAAAAAERKRLGSLYLRCDGQPNNMTGAESFARLLGAVTLLALFAPSPEAADPSKRLFGEKGIDACSRLLDDPTQETNGFRRVPLILARAVHQIEAKNYPAALADIERARGEAKVIGLVGNPYFDRSMGLSFDNLEAQTRLRMGDAQAAQDVSLRRVDTLTYSFVPLLYASDFGLHLRGLSPRAEKLLVSRARLDPVFINDYANRLEEAGRFADAATQREALIAAVERLKGEKTWSGMYAVAAISHALAGNWDKAATRADFARKNMDERAAAGDPEEAAPRIVEMLDLHDVLARAQAGGLAEARRSYAARSRWTVSSFGAIVEADRRLRAGAKAEELTGALAASPEALWEERRSNRMAAELKSDTDNKTLFQSIVPYAQIGDFEGRSKDVYRLDKSRMMGLKANEKNDFWSIYAIYAPVQVRMDAILLHAALQAQKRGKQGFLIGGLPSGLSVASVQFVDRAEAGLNTDQVIDAAEVVAELGKVIPSPLELETRRKAKR